MAIVTSVTVRRSVGRRLQDLRRAAGKTWQDVDVAGIAGRTKLHQIENTTKSLRTADVMALCLLYGVDDTTREQLTEMARNTAGPGWWEDYKEDVPSWFAMYVELESAATSLWTWQPVLIPGLLQTPAYLSALFDAAGTPREDAERKIRVRAERQRAILERPSAPELVALIDEGTLGRRVGEPRVMAEQRQHLLRMSARDNVSVRVLPWSAGAHVAMQGAFNGLSFDGPDVPNVIYLETEVGGRYFEQASVVDRYRGIFEAVRDMSVPIEEYQQ